MTLPAVSGLPRLAGPTIVGDPVPAALASPLAVAECATASVAACLAAAAELAFTRTGRRPAVRLDTAHVAAAVRSELLLRDPAGNPVEGFAPLSRLWPSADGWVRTHGNYPWHRAALLRALEVTDDRQVAAAIAERAAAEVEEAVYAAGGLAVAARTRGQWDAERPPDDSPLVATAALGAAEPLPSPGGALPAAGLRVLDLTRTIAGPVATRMLAAFGADVLRVDDPRRPELPLHAVDGVIGKASTCLDAGSGRLRELAARADVIVTGYRPGALDRFGLGPGTLAERHPGTILVTLSAWAPGGVWGGRRGFDSLVQIATGIGWAAGDARRPGTLPCQLLDHATGYLLAAAALTALTRRARDGVATHVHASLERTARWLLEQGPRDGVPGSDADPEVFRVPLGDGWTSISAPGEWDGHPLRWPRLPVAYGRAPAAWR